MGSIRKVTPTAEAERLAAFRGKVWLSHSAGRGHVELPEQAYGAAGNNAREGVVRVLIVVVGLWELRSPSISSTKRALQAARTIGTRHSRVQLNRQTAATSNRRTTERVGTGRDVDAVLDLVDVDGVQIRFTGRTDRRTSPRNGRKCDNHSRSHSSALSL